MWRVVLRFGGKYGLASVIAGCLLLLAACESGSASVSTPVDPFGWNRGQEESVTFLNADTVSLRELYVFIAYDRITQQSEGLKVNMTVTSPDSLSFTETVQMVMGDAKCSGKLSVSRRLYRSDVVFDKVGEYRFSFRHIHGEPVKGIRAVGVEIKDRGDGER